MFRIMIIDISVLIAIFQHDTYLWNFKESPNVL